MGQYLSSPVTDKETVQQHLAHLEVGISSQQGWRKTQEDAHISSQIEENTLLFGVFDGHGGGEVSKFCAQNIHTEITKISAFKDGDYAESLVAVFHRMDEIMQTPEGLKVLQEMKEPIPERSQEDERSFDFIKSLISQQNGAKKVIEQGSDCDVQAGCTAVVALLTGNKLYVANAGDSRAVLCRKGKAIPLSFDHKPSHPTEKERIESAGGFISNFGGMSRVNGNLNLSRAIGDLKYKGNKELHPKHQIITAEPDIEETTLQVGDEFLILACDGIWDVMTNQEAVDFVGKGLEQGKSCSNVACDILDFCIATDPKESRGIGCDNMTCCIVRFKDEFYLKHSDSNL